MSRARDIAAIPGRNADNKTGLIAFFAQATAPDGWLECNGAAVSRTTYADLFAELGTENGAGDGSTTFNLPDLRGEFIRGWDNGRGIDSGRARGSAQEGTGLTLANNTSQLFGSTPTNEDGYYDASATRAVSSATATTATYAHARVRPRNIALLGCIKT